MQASFGNIYSTVSLEKEYAVQGFGKIVLFQSVSIYGLQFPTPAIACIYKLRDQDELEELYTKGQTQCLVKVYDGVLFRTCMSHYLYNSWTWPSPLLLIGVRVWCVMFCVGGLNHAIKRNKLLKCTAVACLFLRRIVLEVDILCKRFNMHRVWHMIYRSISSFFFPVSNGCVPGPCHLHLPFHWEQEMCRGCWITGSQRNQDADPLMI